MMNDLLRRMLDDLESDLQANDAEKKRLLTRLFEVGEERAQLITAITDIKAQLNGTKEDD